MKNLFFLFAILCTSSIFSQGTYTKKLAPFDELRVYNKIHVELIKDTEDFVEIKGSNTEFVNAILVDRILRLKVGLDNILKEETIKVIVHYTSLKKIDINEGSEVYSNKTIKESNFEIRVQEGSTFKGAIETQSLYAKAVSGSSISISGTCEMQDVNIQTGGQYLASKFKTKTTNVKVSAGGKANVFASDYIKANTNAGGVIKMYGNPKEVETKKVLGGRIIKI